jgi:hypothetical protein
MNNDGEKPHKCDFWGEYSVMVCNEPAPYKMTYCKHHYEIMADVIMKDRDNNSRQRRRIDRMLEINNWFQHE